jgi:hypothetical protein
MGDILYSDNLIHQPIFFFNITGTGICRGDTYSHKAFDFTRSFTHSRSDSKIFFIRGWAKWFPF